MKKLLAAMFVALLMVGCGEDGKSGSDGPESNQSSAPPPESTESSAETPPAKSPEVAEFDLDDNETRNKIIAEWIELDKLREREERKRAEEIERQYGKIIVEAIDWEKLQERGEEGEELYYASNQQTPYAGWAKYMHDNGRVNGLLQYKDGKKDGLWTGWHENGQKAFEENYKDGKGDGLWIRYWEDGTEIDRQTFKDGELVED